MNIKKEEEKPEKKDLEKTFGIVVKLMTLIGSIAFCLILIKYIFIINEIRVKLILSLFLCAGLCVIGSTLSNILEKYNLEYIFKKAYVIIFSIYWFGFLIIFDYLSIKNNQYEYLLFSIPFWIVGIYFIVYKKIIKNN